MTYLSEAERKEVAKNYLLKHTEQLKAAGVGFLVGFFDGEGDDGTVTHIAYLSPKINEDDLAMARFDGDVDSDVPEPEGIFPEPKPGDQEYSIEDTIWQLAPDGFENNAGGFGAVIFNVNTGKIKVNYSYRVEDSSEADYEV